MEITAIPVPVQKVLNSR